jgi:hypothetical protein
MDVLWLTDGFATAKVLLGEPGSQPTASIISCT